MEVQLQSMPLPVRAEHGDLPALCELWDAVFHDGREFASAFLNFAFDCGSIWVCKSGEEAVSMATLLPLTLKSGDCISADLHLWYLYGLCTKLGYEGRGYASRLVASLLDYGAEEGVAGMVTQPATEALVGFYARLGFGNCCQRAIIRRKIDNCLESGEFPALRPITPAEFNRRREEILQTRRHVAYSERLFDFIVRCLASEGGGIYACGESIAAVQFTGGGPRVLELLGGSAEEKQMTLNSIGKRCHCESIDIVDYGAEHKSRLPPTMTTMKPPYIPFLIE